VVIADRVSSRAFYSWWGKYEIDPVHMGSLMVSREFFVLVCKKLVIGVLFMVG